ncbi:MAG: NDP-sugar synthase [Alphaproteobacteria bacterium]|nr:NDP-sugar synthase [Alphaproteobacteria bacterium]
MDHDAFVLAAGFGTRLQPLTHHRPKPLVPVCGVPMLAYALALCARHDLRRVVVNAHHLADQIGAWHGRQLTDHGPVDVHVAVEAPEILGTGGGLRAVRDRLAPAFAVVNADVLSNVDLTALRAAVRPGGAAMALRPHEADRFGHVSADASDTVVELVDLAAATPHGDVRRDTHFTGLHALHRDALDLVPDGPACIVRTAYRALVPQRRVAALRHAGTWLDVGDPAAYLAANLAVLTTHLALPLDPTAHAAWARLARGAVGEVPDGVEVVGTAWVGPGADVGRGVVLHDSVVGPGAVVPDGTRLTRCVVWDGVVIPAGTWRDGLFFGRPGVSDWLHVPTVTRQA